MQLTTARNFELVAVFSFFDTQIQVSQLDYSSYLGIIGIGRIKRGTLRVNQQVTVLGADGSKRNGKVGQVFTYLGLERRRENPSRQRPLKW